MRFSQIKKIEVGAKFGSLTVLGLSDQNKSKNGNYHWLCKCEGCGEVVRVRGDNLRMGHSTQCFSCARQKKEGALCGKVMGRFSEVTLSVLMMVTERNL